MRGYEVRRLTPSPRWKLGAKRYRNSQIPALLQCHSLAGSPPRHTGESRYPGRSSGFRPETCLDDDGALRMQSKRLIRDERGFAMVLAVSMIVLLSLFGIWMLVESQTAFRITASMERREAAFNLAEGALQLDYRCLIDNTLSPSYAQLVSKTPTNLPTSGITYMSAEQTLASDNGTVLRGRLTPTIQYLTYSPTPPAGWMMNWQGSSSFHSIYYKPMGDGTISLPSNKGNARTVLSGMALRVTR